VERVLGYLHWWTANPPGCLLCRWELVPFSAAGAWKLFGMQAALQYTASAGGVLCDRYAFSNGHVSLVLSRGWASEKKKEKRNE
jgi:hypothetical protein